MLNQMLEAALRYADDGWAVFPLHGIQGGRCTCGVNCGSPGKHPRTSSGFKDATTDVSTIQRWWGRWPSANIGVATGSVSGIYVLDLDNKRNVDLGGGTLIGEGEHSIRVNSQSLGVDLPDTKTSLTGSGGSHLVFSYPTEMSTESGTTWGNRAGVLSSVDIRGDGGYIVAPPSLHQSGQRYRWLEADHPLSELPDAWMTFLSETSSTDSNPTLTLSDDVLIKAGEGRHEWLFRYASKLRGQHGLDYLPLYGALSAVNARHMDPPLEPKEVEHIVVSCMKFDVGMPPIPLDTGIPDLLEGEDVATPFAAFMAEEPEPWDNLVAKLLHSGECMILGGPPNIGKTWIVMDMMLGISSGTRFVDHFNCEPTTVLFIDEEGSRRGDWERFTMLLSGRDQCAVDFPIYTKIDSGIKLDNPRGLAAISRLIERYRPGAVFLDSLVRMHGGNEADNRVMASLFETVKRLMVNYETSFIFTHHIRKPSKDAGTDPMWMLRGASDIQGFPDSIGVLLPGEDTSEVEFVHTKMRNGEKHKNFVIKLQIEDDDGRARLGYLEPTVQATTNKAREDIQLILSEGTKFSTEEIAALTGLSVPTVASHLKVLGAMNAVRSTREAGTYYHQIGME
jgi:DNA-binding CsgD family transcriptional regulator